jgi:hypothetical protein
VTLTNVTIQGGTSNVSTNSIVNGTSNVAIASANGAVTMVTNGNTAVTIDTSQNVGVGVTPSAWRAVSKATQIGYAGSLVASTATNNVYLGSNWYINSTPADTYINNGYASLYQQQNGIHYWYNAPSGTAGGTITFTQAMTLNNSSNGQLGIGVSPNSGWASSTYSVAQVGAYGSFYANNLNTSTGYNLYYDGTNNRYANNGYAAVMSWASNGQIQTFTAGSGTAGNTISFTAGPYVANTATTSVTVSQGTPTLTLADINKNFGASSLVSNLILEADTNNIFNVGTSNS